MSEQNDQNLSETSEQLEVQAAAADQTASQALEGAVEDLVAKIKAGAVRMEEATRPSARPAETPVAAAPRIDAATMQRVNALLEENPALKAYTNDILIPSVMSGISRDAKRERRDITRDPVLGPLFRQNEAKIDQIIASRQIGDAFIVEHGYEDLIKIADPVGYVNATQPKSDTPPPVKATLTPDQAGRAPRTEGTYTGVVSQKPNTPQGQTRDAQIAAIQVTPAEVESARQFYGMDEKELKEQRFEMQRHRARLGDDFISQFGTPICNLQERMPRKTNPDGSLGDYVVIVREE